MEWSYSNLRKTSEVPGLIPWKNPLVAILRLHAEGNRCDVIHARTVGDKQALLEGLSPSDCVLVAWPGQHRQDVFLLDSMEEARSVLFAPRKAPQKR